MSGGVDFELIELLDADPSAFGPAADVSASRPPRPPRPRPQWLVPALIATVAIIATAAALLVWKPWVNDFKIRLAFPAATPTEPTLTEQLVFDVAPAELTAASLGKVEGDVDAFADAGGYFFGEPEANLRLGQIDTGRWALFYASAADDETDFESRGQAAIEVTIQGAPGQLLAAVGDPLTRLAFGPLNGLLYTVVASELSHEEAIAFADVVTFDDGAPAVSDISALDGMMPLFSVEDFSMANSLLLGAISSESSQPQVVSTHYGLESERFTVTSQRAPDAGLAPLQFLFGGEIDAVVHGEQALSFDVDTTDSLFALDVDLGSVVAWVEGGRLVMVTGQLPLAELLALAESVRPATEAEWSEIEQVAG